MLPAQHLSALTVSLLITIPLQALVQRGFSQISTGIKTDCPGALIHPHWSTDRTFLSYSPSKLLMPDGGRELVSQDKLLHYTLAFELLFGCEVFQAYTCYEVPQHCERWLNALPRVCFWTGILYQLLS